MGPRAISPSDQQLTAMSAIWHPSPNFGMRRDGLLPTLIVLHFTAMSTAEAALERLCDPVAEVSAHYLIGCDGTLWQMVKDSMRAWHAGAGEWGGLDDINSRSIGIELDNSGDHPFGEPQMQTLEQLLGDTMSRRGIGADGVIGHSDMAPGRKCDPGRRFDWARLARQGLARGAGGQSVPPDMALFRAHAERIGFTAPADDSLLLETVRLRYRPWGQGPLSRQDMACLPEG